MNILEFNSPAYQEAFFEGFITPLLPSLGMGLIGSFTLHWC